MRSVDNLLNAIVRFKAAEHTVNNLSVPIDDTPEEAAFHAAIADVGSGNHIATTPTGAMAALRLLQKEMVEFDGSNMSKALIDGAMAYFDGIEEVSGSGVIRDALNMVGDFPDMKQVSGSGWFAVQDGLNTCVDILGGIINRPQCEIPGRHRLNAAGEYLESIEQFLMFEKTRVMSIAAGTRDDEQETDKHHRLRAILALRADEAELSIEQLEQVIASIDGMDAGRVAI